MEEWHGENREWYISADNSGSWFYHVHDHCSDDQGLRPGYFFVNKEGRCRDCNEQAPKGIRFVAATARLRSCL